jgi:hypothetical protein
MNILKTIGRFFRRSLLGILLGYWAIFIGYTVVKLIDGGPHRVLAWYMHLAGTGIQWKGDSLVFREWNWKEFIAVQAAYLAITLVVCFFEWRSSCNRIMQQEGE